jgi:hypothetical protein
LLGIRLSISIVMMALIAPPAAAASFPAVVRAILDAQTDGRLAKMGGDRRARMTDCVIASLAGLPGGKKRFIVEGVSLDEQGDRFGEVVQEDRAKWKQHIAQSCSRIALESDNSD